MKVLLLGVGLLGERVAKKLGEEGHFVIGTTTTPVKVQKLSSICGEVVVLTGDDAEEIARIGSRCDAVVVTVGPNIQRASNPSTREEEYRRSLSVTGKNAAAANPRVVFASSLSVYGDGGRGSSAITEDTPRTNNTDASPRYYREAEEHVLAAPEGVVLRFPDLYGAENDLSYVERVRLGHALMNGRVPFAPDALLYRVHVEDAAAAIVHVLKNDLTGVYNVVDNRELPPTNQALFDRLADENGLQRLKFISRIRLPSREISGQKLVEAGFSFKHTDYHFA